MTPDLKEFFYRAEKLAQSVVDLCNAARAKPEEALELARLVRTEASFLDEWVWSADAPYGVDDDSEEGQEK